MTHFQPQPDDDHPVRWSPLTSSEPDRWLSVADALDRLTRDDPAERTATEMALMRGDTLRTMFALYTFTPRQPGQR